MPEIIIACKHCTTEQTVVVGGATSDSNCRSCKQPLFEVSEVNGYVLSNPYMPGLLKVGLTERTVDERVNDLNRATGVPEDLTDIKTRIKKLESVNAHDRKYEIY
jgi:hypothetical protein